MIAASIVAYPQGLVVHCLAQQSNTQETPGIELPTLRLNRYFSVSVRTEDPHTVIQLNLQSFIRQPCNQNAELCQTLFLNVGFVLKRLKPSQDNPEDVTVTSQKYLTSHLVDCSFNAVPPELLLPLLNHTVNKRPLLPQCVDISTHHWIFVLCCGSCKIIPLYLTSFLSITTYSSSRAHDMRSWTRDLCARSAFYRL